VNEAGAMVVRRKLQRSELIAFFEKQASCTLVMEACREAHHWARVLTGLDPICRRTEKRGIVSAGLRSEQGCRKAMDQA